MTGPKDLDPSSRRIMIGEELHHARERAGLTQQALGELLFVSGSYVGQMEAGTRRILPDMAHKLDEILGAGGFFVRHCTKANRSKHPEQFAEAAEAEAMAIGLQEYAGMLIPGLLQIPDYARAVFLDYQPTAPDEVINELLAARMERTHLLDNPTKPLLWVVLDEAALRRPVGGPEVMARNLRHIAELARIRRIVVQVLPFSAGGHASLHGSLKIMFFEDAPPLALIEAPATGQLMDDPATVARHQLSYDLLRANALTPKQSLALIASVAEDYAHEDHDPRV
ncbi:helix-turn-helix domain-containing protein [Streptomyces beijiangensis]|uniref:Helix-turn-helix transcriptional regulator n=1 Tax=Streptomyces beijiangensis TaxID=163361 RepID=A0A939FHI1_9ACTN|nr:helix-turn-helix transcriptional regulator [Streptomyces beijiangensis]MBO0517230.1 helix-turn-helix transcriptional regulator [Streptomyces beijiangensis]